MKAAAFLMISITLAGCGGASSGAIAPPAQPKRIVSINPCIDAILMEVADPQSIAAISHYSQDPDATSIPLAEAAHFATTSGTAEEILAIEPDLVLATFPAPAATLHALRQRGIPIVQLPIPQSIADSEAQILQIGSAIGQADRGRQLVGRINAAVAAARPANGPPVDALLWGEGGMVPGSGTLIDDVMIKSGFRNMSGHYGLQQWDVLPLEPLIARPPAILFSTGQEGRLATHPALRHIAGRSQRVALSPHLLNCGGPTIIAALGRMAEVRASLVAHSHNGRGQP